MQPAQNTAMISSTSSKYHRKTQKKLYDFLINSFGFSELEATLVITVHECSDMAQLMSLFMLDDDLKYSHIFVPHVEDPVGARCRICQERRNMHINDITWQELTRFEEELKTTQVKNLFQHLHEQQKLSMDDPDSHQHHQSMQELIESLGSQPQQMLHSESTKFTYKTCCICYGNFQGDDEMVSIGGVMHQVCLNCMSEYLKEEILNLRIENMKCPHCAEPIGADIVKEYVSNTLFQKYKTFSRNLSIQKNPNFKWCPNPKCSVVINITNNKKNTAKCPKCDTVICTKCNGVAHPKQSCDQVIRNIYKDLENASDIQKCRKCRALVEKIAGCNHMTCGVCKYEWCWLCGSTYSDIHFSPLNPLGCAGMQNRNLSGFAKCKIYFLRVLMIIGFLILLPVVIPCVMVFCGPVLLYNFITKKMCRSYNCCFHIVMALLSLPLGLIIDPFVWIGALIYFVPSICRAIGNWFDRRRNMIQSSQNQIKRRLLEDGEAVVVSES